MTYENDNYKVQHPVTFSSWPPTDPLSHVTESNLEDESDLAGLSAETRVDIFSSDSVNITSKHFTTEPGFQAGLYASYHVYPYWPDFLNNEPRYKEYNDRFGPSSYYGYLAELKEYYNDRPLLIAEYGLPNGPLPVHIQPQGWNHGGLSEAAGGEGHAAPDVCDLRLRLRRGRGLRLDRRVVQKGLAVGRVLRPLG